MPNVFLIEGVGIVLLAFLCLILSRHGNVTADGKKTERILNARFLGRKAGKPLAYTEGKLVNGNVAGAGGKIMSQLMDENENTHEKESQC